MRLHSTFFTTVLLIFATAATEMATNIYVPTLSYLVSFFSVSKDVINLTLSLNLLGFSIACLVYGPLSDAYGRKIVTVWGMGLFVLSSYFCSMSMTIEWLIIFRILQGVGSAVAGVVGTAIIKDLYQGEECARALSSMGIAIAISPAIAPVLGGYIASYLGWQYVFTVVGSVALLIFAAIILTLDETLPTRLRQPFSVTHTIMSYKKILKSFSYMSFACISAATFSGLWAYISATAFFYVYLGYDMKDYGYFQMFLVAIYSLGAFINKVCLPYFYLEGMLKRGLYIVTFGSVCLVFVSYVFPQSALALCGAMAINSLGMGSVFANSSTRALDVFPQMKGAASSMLMFIEMGLGSLMVWVTGILYVDKMLYVSYAILSTSLLSLSLYYIHLYVQKNEFLSKKLLED